MEAAARLDLEKRRAHVSSIKRQRQLRREIKHPKRKAGTPNKTGGKDYWQLVSIRRAKKREKHQ